MSKNTSIQDRARMALGEGKVEAAAPVVAAETAPKDGPKKAAQPKKAAAPAPRMDDIRLSVAIAPKVYHRLVSYTNELAMRLGLPRIPHVQVIRALLEELDSDAALSERIAARVTAHYDKR